jgi:branched-chain amino acid aminotransferase
VSAYPHVYFAGRWVNRADAVVPVGSLAMRYAISVFEGIRLHISLDPAAPPRRCCFRAHRPAGRVAAADTATRPGNQRVAAGAGRVDRRNRIDSDAYVRVSVTPTNPGDLGDKANPYSW